MNTDHSALLFFILQLNKATSIQVRKQIIKCKNHFSVFMTNKLIIKTTKAVQSRAEIFPFIVRLTLKQKDYILILLCTDLI